MTLQRHEVTFYMIKVIKLIAITTILVTGFIATALLVYGAVGASSCPSDWEPDTYGECSISVGQGIPGNIVLGSTKASDPVRKAYLRAQKVLERKRSQKAALTVA